MSIDERDLSNVAVLVKILDTLENDFLYIVNEFPKVLEKISHVGEGQVPTEVAEQAYLECNKRLKHIGENIIESDNELATFKPTKKNEILAETTIAILEGLKIYYLVTASILEGDFEEDDPEFPARMLELGEIVRDNILLTKDFIRNNYVKYF